jgi:23S rRNA (guanosine2251-2'-O)-methyltransferase
MEETPRYIYGINPVRSALKAGHIKALLLSRRFLKDPMVQQAQALSIPVRFVEEAELNRLSEGGVHQGMIAEVLPYHSYRLDELLANVHSAYPLLLILDGIEDPQNLGAILRTADAFGVDGLILKSRGEVQMNATVAKVSTGAIDYVKVAVVPNLSQALEKLKEAGYWIVASDGSAQQSYTEVDYRSPIGLIIGSEGFGISSLLVKRSDFVVKIPMFGHVNSLNASVATAVLVSQIVSSRGKK